MPRTEEQFKQMREKTRTVIINAALNLFAKKGYKGTSIADIAKEAGVSKGLAYNYFESKEKLAESVFLTLNNKIGELFSELITIEDPSEQLKLMIEKTFDFIKEDETYWRLYMSFILNPEVKGLADDVVGNFVKDALQFVNQIFEKLNTPNAELETKMFGAALDGICFHYLLDVKKYPINEMKEFLLNKYCIKNK